MSSSVGAGPVRALSHPPAVHPLVDGCEEPGPRALHLDCSVNAWSWWKHLVVQSGLPRGSGLGRCPWPPGPVRVQEGLLAHRACLLTEPLGRGRWGPSDSVHMVLQGKARQQRVREPAEASRELGEPHPWNATLAGERAKNAQAQEPSFLLGGVRMRHVTSQDFRLSWSGKAWAWGGGGCGW